MPYTYTSSPQNAVSGKSFVSPKTHGPGSRLLNLGHRYYSPDLGRWISRDPLEELGGLNLFAFIFNRPTNLVDPDGQYAFFTDLPAGMPWHIQKAVEDVERQITDILTMLAQATAMNSCCFAQCAIRVMIPGIDDVANYVAEVNAEVNGFGRILNEFVLSHPQSNYNILKWCKQVSVTMASIAGKVSKLFAIKDAIEFKDCMKKCRKCPAHYGCEPGKVVVN